MSQNVSRRRFIDYLLGGGLIAWLGAIIYPLYEYLKPPPVAEAQASTVKVGAVDEFPANSAQIFKFGRKPGILLHTADGEWKAFHATCTHLDCTVQYKPDWKLFWCACHNGRYSIDGVNISGPPPRPLSPFAVHIKDGEVYVSREA